MTRQIVPAQTAYVPAPAGAAEAGNVGKLTARASGSSAGLLLRGESVEIVHEREDFFGQLPRSLERRMMPDSLEDDQAAPGDALLQSVCMRQEGDLVGRAGEHQRRQPDASHRVHACELVARHEVRR